MYRASAFLYLTMATTGGALLGPLLSGLLMARFGPWVPIAVVMSTIPPVYITFLFLPETLQRDSKKQIVEGETAMEAFRSHMVHGVKDLTNSLGMLKNRNVLLCLVPFFFTNARSSAATTTLAQYVSRNFSWTLAEVSVLLSPLGIINFAVLACLPKISELLMSPRFGYTSFEKDLFLGRISFLIIAVSALIRALSSNIAPFLMGLVIGSFGAADTAIVRATITTFVDTSYTSRLFALVNIVEVLGTGAGPPLLAWFFDLGMRLRGAWTGLPWLYLACVCFLTWLALLFVRAPRKTADGERQLFGEDGYNEEDENSRPPFNPVRLD